MFFHCFKYSFIDFIRNKVVVFWVVLFPMILGTLFNFAFSGIYDQETRFKEIPVAIVNGCEQGGVKSLVESLENDGTKFLNAQYVDEETALDLLGKSEIDGIIYDDMLEPTLTVRAGGGLAVSVMKVFLDRYKTNASIIYNIIQNDPSKLQAVIDNMSEETVECLTEKKLSDGNMNAYTSYFYNLLAMSCLFVSMIGQFVAINNQANLSAVGARVTVSPAARVVQVLSALSAAFLIFFTGVTVSTAYLFYVLKIDFGISFGDVIFVNLFGIIFGLALGFFVGSIGRMQFNTKLTILLIVSLGTGFLSGLMAGNIPILIEENCPIINRLNPSRLICDSFYAINSYGYGDRLWRNIITLSVMTVLLIAGGCLMMRNRKFKAL